MEYWLEKGWTEHQTRHWYSLRQVKRDGAGNIMRLFKGGTHQIARKDMPSATSEGPSSRIESAAE
eukprot:2697547-Pyramimonas_sp.AAC.1